MRCFGMIVLGLLLASSGCASTGGFAMFKNRDYADPTDGPDEEWITKAGEEGRGGHPREKSEEPRWFREMVMSDRAREIERNLGIDD